MNGIVKRSEPRTSVAQNLLEEQVGNGFTAAQQYVAIAVWFDQRDLPRLAAHFYRRAARRREDAMRVVQYMMDNNIAVEIPGVPSVRNDFADPREPIALALEQEHAATREFTALSEQMRREGDHRGEQLLRCS
ncbi:hypothetical protein GCM10011581_40340 [Saccharopolyspora subtropica]|uniref:Ferritin-like diiron domain-containing protein n=1 Tax=Saccharopolyspora thermophila TaxID=89367 RepID=A0A917K4V5_9PSEU|nr:ferritin-like domain-containing protein [Saccharopolyspora subtropica]GGI99015.1 hypothetical protein GCM10011581_40340 [Saccharopolyspora subtropica]